MAEETIWTGNGLILTLSDDASVYLKDTGSGQVLALIPSSLRIEKMSTARTELAQTRRTERDATALFRGLLQEFGYSAETAPASLYLLCREAVSGNQQMIALLFKLLPSTAGASQKSGGDLALDPNTTLRLLRLLETGQANAPDDNSR